MAKAQPPPNGCNATIASAEASDNERSLLSDLNRKSSCKLGPKADLVKELEATLGLDQLKTKSSLKDLADLGNNYAKLGELSDKHGLKVTELRVIIPQVC
jgi:hypothetical protein